MTTNYTAFLETKKIVATLGGIEVSRDSLHLNMKPFQRDLTAWALRKGRAAIFADTGLGKAIMQLEWARLAASRTLILAPLAVAKQTVLEAAKWDIEATYCRDESAAPREGIVVANYEMLGKFNPDAYGAIVLDESGILKSFDGKTRTRLIETFADYPFRLCCTATPAPNDISEIANHAEFLGLMTRVEMLSAFFVHDDKGWRLKGHAREPFYRWLASWGMSIKRPSDLGYDDDGYILPPLSIEPLFVQTDYKPDGMLFAAQLKGITERSSARRATMQERVAKAVEIVSTEPDEQWLVWCGMNDESTALTAALKDAVEVKGSDKQEHKESALLGFAAGTVQVLVTKPKIAGHGLNLQRCARMVFVGLNDSYEQYYQAIRRCWRFGQSRPVNIYIVLSDAEYAIYENVMRKEKEAEATSRELVKNVAQYEQAEITAQADSQFVYNRADEGGDGWQLMLGDSCERLKEIANDSIDFSVYSPPFASLYTYSPSERDLGNSKSDDDFFHHFEFIIREVLRVTKPGRVTAVHVADLPAMLVRDGYIGLKDFSGDVIRAYIAAGWILDARIPIDKNQQAQSIRTHAKGLTMTQMKKDRTWSRPALPDYILKFRKPGENLVPVRDGMTGDEWIELANPTWPSVDGDRCGDAGAFATWYDIKESRTLNVVEAREGNDERHICALQLETIERCIRLWSNPGEIVLTPFAGIGSEVYTAIKLRRKAIGCELKPSYFKTAVANARRAESDRDKDTLFSLMEESEPTEALA